MAIVCLSSAAVVPAGAQTGSAPPPQTGQAAPRSDLDAFMEKVLARRDVNKTTLNQYVLDETEAFEILGPGRVPLHRMKRDFTWYVRDGLHVRSPVRINGVRVGDNDRDEYERKWVRREKRRLERKAKKEKEPPTTTGDLVMNPEPNFVSEAYFMDFKFEPGNYYLAGREKLDGQEVLRIEYYPTRLFDDSEGEKEREARQKDRRQRRDRSDELEIDRKMNKTALVTLWVDPGIHQIVKYTFDNVWLDFLPGAWLVRVDDIRASMSMGQPFPGVWLPREINIHAGLTLANGSFEATYGRTFAEYREAQVTSTIRVPKKRVQGSRFTVHGSGSTGFWVQGSAGFTVQSSGSTGFEDGAPRFEEEPRGSGPFVADEGQAAPPSAVIREVRVHGNAFVTDEEVLRLAAVSLGDPATDEALAAIARRLEESGRFETVDVRKRQRSLSDPADVAIVLVVHEKPGVRSGTGDAALPGPMRRFTSKLMFLPILGYADGYGFTYGARVSTVDLLGLGERLSVPGTWGGTRRIALEFERPFKSGPLTRVTSSIALWSRDNPHYEPQEDQFAIDERRVEFKAGAEREFARVVRTGVEATRSEVRFLGATDQIWTFGASGALDTRLDPAFPSNAVYVGGGWSALNVKGLSRINRYSGDLRGYLRLVGQAVLAGRLQYFTADATMPAYERFLLGGSPTLRGFRGGAFIADEMLITGGELRVPITSVMNAAKFGLTMFYDAARSADHDGRLGSAPWRRGAGGGVFLIAPFVRLNLDVARGFDGDTRVHLATGFAF